MRPYPTPRSRRPTLLAGLAAVLTACHTPSSPPPDAADTYQQFLNTAVPAESHHFAGYIIDNSLTEVYRGGYFSYELPRPALDRLLRHARFPEPSEWNRAFQPRPARQIIQKLNLAYYRSRLHLPLHPTAQHTLAYEATFYPFVHTLLYDTTTQRVQHFVTEMSD